MRRALFGFVLAALTAAPASAAVPVSLRGSNDAMQRQHGVAVEAGYTFVRSRSQMAALEAAGELVRLEGNDDYGLREGVSHMVARPEMKVFIERLARDYRSACGEKLIVTSLTRPMDRQPRNAHRLSVHPAGIAADFRVSRSADCRRWLENALLDLEEEGLLDGIRERSPPHYHVALFPDAYMARVAPLIEAERAAERAHLLADRYAVLAAGMVDMQGIGGRDAVWGALALVPLAFLVVLLLGRARERPVERARYPVAWVRRHEVSEKDELTSRR